MRLGDREHISENESVIKGVPSSRDPDNLFRQVASQRYLLLLTDPIGVTVDCFGDRLFQPELQQAGLYLGSHWLEEPSGTSADGAGIQSGKAVRIHQSDHFDLAHTPLSRTAGCCNLSMAQR